MTKAEFIKVLSQKVKLIRVEMDYSQEKMAAILSISKKTLIEVEKGRTSLNWCSAVTLAVIFSDSEIIDIALGGDIVDSIKSIAFEHYESYPRTMGGRVWWSDMRKVNGYRLQQNIISKHYRILNTDNCRICSSFDLNYIEERLKQLSEVEGGDPV